MTAAAAISAGAIDANAQQEAPRDGPRIREIRIEVVDVYPEDQAAESGWKRTVNRWHIETRESVIRTEILFKEGDVLDQDLIEAVKEKLATIDATVSEEKDLGRREFVRVTDRNFTAGHYYELSIEAPESFADDVQARFRLDKVVYRIIVQA